MCHSGDKKKTETKTYRLHSNMIMHANYAGYPRIKILDTCLRCSYAVYSTTKRSWPPYCLFSLHGSLNHIHVKYYHNLGTFPNANRKILLIDKIDISNTQRISPGTPVSSPIKLTTTI